MAEKRKPKAVEADQVDAIRDILFGPKMQDYERRFTGLEKRLDADLAKLREVQSDKLDRLETHTQQVLDKITADLRAERDERKAADKTGDQARLGAVETLEAQLEKTRTELAAQLDAARQATRALEKAQQSALSVELSDLRATVDEQLATLTDQKLDREELAAYFFEIALRLRRELELAETND